MPYYGMSVSVVDQASPFVERLQMALDQGQINTLAGRTGVNEVKKHLYAKDSAEPNIMGGTRTHFYSDAARSTAYAETIDRLGVVISINKEGIAQRYHGGVIEPVNAKNLAIPARAEAHGKRPREFDNLEVLFGRHGAYGLAERQASIIEFKRDRKTKKWQGESISRGEMGSLILFWLVDSVNQAADETVLPPEDELSTAVAGEINQYVLRCVNSTRN